MNKIVLYGLGFLILFPIIIGYYADYKNNPKEFKLSIKSLWNKRLSQALLFLIIYWSLIKVWESFF